MEAQEALMLLEQHNKWRKGADVPMIHPKVLSEVIDTIVKEFSTEKNGLSQVRCNKENHCRI